jgi:hypothetical protein
VFGHRGEDVEDPAAHGELATTRDHVDAGIRQLDEALGELGQLVPAPLYAEDDGFDRIQARRDRLQGGADGRHDDEGRIARVRGDPAQHLEARTDGLGARAEALMREGLPCRKGEHRRTGKVRLQRRRQLVGAAAGGRDREEHRRLLRPGALVEERGEGGRDKALDEREVGVDGCRSPAVSERA